MMKKLDRLIKRATAKISDTYFLLHVVDGEDKYRERVYAYELYHQMRMRWASKRFFLNGEVDKKGHPRFPDSGPQPDLIIHEPGTDNNEAVFEIKSCNAQNKGIIDDLRKLHELRELIHYKRAIYLIYGTTAGDRAKQIVKRKEYSNKIEIWLHLAPLKPAFREY